MADFSRTVRAEQRNHLFTLYGETVSYETVSSTTNLQTGVITPTNTPNSVTALIGSVSDKLVKDSGGRYRVGDRVFRIKNADMPETPPSETSVIVFDSKTFNVVGHDQSSDDNMWDVIGRKNSG